MSSSARPLIFGVLNVTPDSFSDGGQFLEPEAAIAQAQRLIAEGADVIDVGGESTRPGAKRVSIEEEQRRVLPVIEALTGHGFTVSIDTVHAGTASKAVAAGATYINDVSGGTADPQMLSVAAQSGAGLVLMHWRGIPDPGHSKSNYADVVIEVRDELAALAEAAIAAGVARDRIILDPGLGFDKTAEQGWELIANLDALAELGFPLLIGVSRKRMLAETLGKAASMADRDLATAVVSAEAARNGAWGVRVHNVAATANALAVQQALSNATRPPAMNKSASRPPATSKHASEPADRDRITLTGLEVFAHHGVFDFEREAGQKFLIDAEVTVDLSAAAESDQLTNTVHYGELAEAILAAAQKDPVDLIETLAERIANVALAFDGVRGARITVHKPQAPIRATFADVSVTIERSERGVT